MNLSRKKSTSKAMLALAGILVLSAAIILIPDHKEGGSKESGIAAAEHSDDSKSQDLADRDVSGQKVASPKVQEKPVANTGTGYRELEINGVPVQLKWRFEQFSEEEIVQLAEIVYQDFWDIHMDGKREDQLCHINQISYDYDTPKDLEQIFSKLDGAMVWRLDVMLPDNWKEDKGMGMMQQEESQRQEYDTALVKNEDGEWEIAESVWRVYYDKEGHFRW